MTADNVEVFEVERQETVRKLNVRIRDLETALNNAADHAKAQEARIKALEAERVKDGHGFKTFCGCTGCASIRSAHVERDALRAEVDQQKDKAQELVDDNANMHARLYECAKIASDASNASARYARECLARIRAIAAGKA